MSIGNVILKKFSMSFFGPAYILSLVILQSQQTLATTCVSCTQISFNVKDAFKDRALIDERKLKETTVQHDPQCSSECSKDCRCLSFNVCGKTCQLNAGNRFLLKNKLRVKVGCRYYDFPKEQSKCEVKFSDPPGICCAQLSPPCFNGGICGVNISDTTRRFFCQCPPGFYGDQCQIKKPQTCLDYWTGPIKPISREYTIEDHAGNPYKVFCDFDSEVGIAWTLIQAFSLGNYEQHVLAYPLTVDHPLNQNNFNWALFRLPKTTISNIKSRSTFYRGTCSYSVYGIDFRDYLRWRVSAGDLTVDALGNVRSHVEFINIKGTSCVNCTTLFHQSSNVNFLVTPFHCRHYDLGCSFAPSSIDYFCPNTEVARYWGHYNACADPSFRCTETSSSTTEIWLGQVKI